MMIENSCSKNSKKAIDFRDLYEGQIFIYREIPYMKLSDGYVTTKVNNIEMTSKACLEEVKDIRREMYHWLDAVSGETKHTRKIVEEIDKRV